MDQPELLPKGKLGRFLMIFGLLCMAPILVVSFPWWGIDYYDHVIN